MSKNIRNDVAWIAAILAESCSNTVWAEPRESDTGEDGVIGSAGEGTSILSPEDIAGIVNDKLSDILPSKIGEVLPPFGDVTGYVICCILAFTLVAFLGILWLIKSGDQNLDRFFKKRMEKIGKKQEEQTEQIELLKSRIDKMEAELSMENEKVAQAAAPSIRQTVKLQETMSKTPEKQQISSVDRIPRKKPVEVPPWSEFVSAYNKHRKEIAKLDPIQTRKAKQEFFSKFHLTSFNCSNFQDRMSKPSLPPVFAVDGMGVNAYFWAFALSDKTYAVVPNLVSYEMQQHAVGGMGDIFDSNFNAGNTYSDIQVEVPAILSSDWKTITKGRLELR